MAMSPARLMTTPARPHFLITGVEDEVRKGRLPEGGVAAKGFETRDVGQGGIARAETVRDGEAAP
jgi:hypothetical protein